MQQLKQTKTNKQNFKKTLKEIHINNQAGRVKMILPNISERFV